MKGNMKNWLIGLAVAIVLIIPIIINSINSKKIEVKSFNDFYSSINDTSFSLVFFGETEKESYEEYKQVLLDERKKFDINVYTVDKTKLTEDEKKRVNTLGISLTDNSYVIVRDAEIINISNANISKDSLEVLINKYYNNVIPADEIAYKTVSTYKEYMALVNSKKVTMAVFGRNSCGWCNKYKPIYNELAKENNIDIYYFDSDVFDKSEYSKILNSGLTIPAKCTSTKVETPLSSGFGTPLTLFTKNGKTIDCISGYTNKAGLTSALKDVGLIK